MFYFQNIADRIIFKFQDKNFAKGISTLIGAAIINFLTGSSYSLCTLSVYEISYIKGIGGDISIEHLTFYYPVGVFFQCISTIISGTIYKKLGLHKTNFIGVIFLILCFFLMYLSKSFLMDMVSMFLGGIGSGIILYPSTTNSYGWFKDHNGIIVGIMETMNSLGNFFFTFLGEKIINKNEIPSNIEDNLYDISIGERIKIFLIIQIISLISGFFISLFLMFEKSKNYENNSFNCKNEIHTVNSDINHSGNKKEYSTQEIENEGKEQNQELKNKEIINSKISKEETKPLKVDSPDRLIKNDLTKADNIPNKNKESKIKKNHNKQILITALKSKRFILYSIISILESPVSSLAFMLYREIGEYEKIDVRYLQLIGSLYSIFECLSSFIFGILSDYIKIKYLLFFITITEAIIGFTYCLSFESSLIFFLIQNFLSFSSGGSYPIKDCFLMQVFGQDNYIELNGIVSFCVALFVNVITPIIYMVISNYENKETAYWILFISSGFSNLIGSILCYFIDESPLDLDNMIKEINNKEN